MDIMYLVGPGENEELRYSLRSLRNVEHGEVWIVGRKPDWVVNVDFLPLATPGNSKFEITRKNMRVFCERSDTPETFVLFNDDFFALRSATIPNWHLGQIGGALRHPRRQRRSGAWRDGLVATKDLLESWDCPTMNYEVHAPMVVEKDKMAEVAAKAGNQIRALQLRSLYGNYWRVGGRLAKDPKAAGKGVTWKPNQRWVSTSDKSFAHGDVGKRLRALFPEPSEFEGDV